MSFDSLKSDCKVYGWNHSQSIDYRGGKLLTRLLTWNLLSQELQLCRLDGLIAVDLLSVLDIRLPRNAERFLGRGGGALFFALSAILNIFGFEHNGKSRWKEH